MCGPASKPERRPSKYCNNGRTAHLILNNYCLLHFSQPNRALGGWKEDIEMKTLFIDGINALSLLHMDYEDRAYITINNSLHINMALCSSRDNTPNSLR